MSTYEFDRTDWAQIIREIDLSGRQIAKTVGIAESYVSYLKRGVKGKTGVDYDIGRRLIALHKMRQLEKRADKETA